MAHLIYYDTQGPYINFLAIISIINLDLYFYNNISGAINIGVPASD
jgi:hypothetical protein